MVEFNELLHDFLECLSTYYKYTTLCCDRNQLRLTLTILCFVFNGAVECNALLSIATFLISYFEDESLLIKLITYERAEIFD